MERLEGIEEVLEFFLPFGLAEPVFFDDFAGGVADEVFRGEFGSGFGKFGFDFAEFAFEAFGFLKGVQQSGQREIDMAQRGERGGAAGGRLGGFVEGDGFRVEERREDGKFGGDFRGSRTDDPGQLFVRGQIVGGAQIAGQGGCGVEILVELADGRIFPIGGGGPSCELDCFLPGGKSQPVPEFFGQEGGEGVEETQDAVKGVVDRCQGAPAARGVVAEEFAFCHFDEAVAEIAPDEVIESLCDFVEAVFGIGGVNLPDGLIEAVEQGAGERGEFVSVGIGGRIEGTVHFAEAAGVPEFVAEVSALGDLVLIEADVLSLWGDAQESEAQAVRAQAVDQIEGIG